MLFDCPIGDDPCWEPEQNKKGIFVLRNMQNTIHHHMSSLVRGIKSIEKSGRILTLLRPGRSIATWATRRAVWIIITRSLILGWPPCLPGSWTWSWSTWRIRGHQGLRRRSRREWRGCWHQRLGFRLPWWWCRGAWFVWRSCLIAKKTRINRI